MLDYHATMPEQAEKLLALGVPSAVASMAWCEKDGEKVLVEIPRRMGLNYDRFRESLVSGKDGESPLKVLCPCWLATDLLDAIPELYCDMLSDEVAEEMDEEENREWSDVEISLSRDESGGMWFASCYCSEGLGTSIAMGTSPAPIDAVIQMLEELSKKISLSIMRA